MSANQVLDHSKSWANYCLEGSILAEAGAQFVSSCENFELLVPTQIKPIESFSDFRFSCGLDSEAADVLLRKLLHRLALSGAYSVVVEDDLMLRTDPILVGPVAFVGERVLRWVSFDTESLDAPTKLIRTGSSGYPLIAYVVDSSPQDMGVSPGAELGNKFFDCVVRSAMAVIVSAFDAETYLVLRP
jgi:hypothetical protein